MDVAAAGVPELCAAQSAGPAGLPPEASRAAVAAMHASMLRSVDLMGVGGNTPQQRQDTVAEDTAALGSACPSRPLMRATAGPGSRAPCHHHAPLHMHPRPPTVRLRP